MVAEIPTMRVGVSTDAGAHYGPVVTAQHKARVEGWIETGVREGAELVVDGRGFSLQGHEKGYFIGPSLFDHVTPEMESYKEEIFGPVLQIVRAASFEEALSLPSKHQYGNGVAIFTQNGRDQRPHPGAGRLSHLRRLEALGLRRHQPARHGGGEVLDQGQDGHRPLARQRPGTCGFELRHPDDGVTARLTGMSDTPVWC
jgi:hypothetical protein